MVTGDLVIKGSVAFLASPHGHLRVMAALCELPCEEANITNNWQLWLKPREYFGRGLLASSSFEWL